MSNTANLGLPLLLAAQAQKHVTVNESLNRLDALTHLTLESVDQTTPPAILVDGACYFVAAGASGSWAGQDGDIAIVANGGWVFVTPKQGWSAFITDQNVRALFVGGNWVAGAFAVSANGATTLGRIIEIDHTLTGGATSTIAAAIPSHSLVTGVTGRVLTTISGSAGSWRLGVSGTDNRYGSSLGLTQSSWVRGLTSSPLAYYSDTDLIITGEGGTIDAGVVRLAIHLVELGLPD